VASPGGSLAPTGKQKSIVLVQLFLLIDEKLAATMDTNVVFARSM
jgi:hypothetical protein